MSPENDCNSQGFFSSRTPELMSRTDTAVLVIDVQEKLLAAIPAAPLIEWNVRRLVEGARVLSLPVLATEQYPQGLGPTCGGILELVDEPVAKKSFSCCLCPEVMERLVGTNASKVLLAGAETHVCVQQTALDLLGGGYRVYIASDAVGSRSSLDHATALRRMDACGAIITTVEAALFEWCETADAPEFKQISRIVRQQPPGA